MFVTESVVDMFQLRGGGSERNFGYTAKMGGYTNMSSDIPKLGGILHDTLEQKRGYHGRVEDSDC
uniref:Uncharacterized protein n=1 Tax=Candidatus Methanophagaceae archaeon ANME-1 ERB6 TaxID=2759912 RepID=A0A7G9YRV0_9EURY|nr:hypothetical protein EGEIMDOP_00019 [Methanosarcinales archaeon ANME-1 ERB6]